MNAATREAVLLLSTRLGRLHVRVVGDGPTTVLWPSMFVDSHTWDDVIPLLRDRRLVLVDGPGLGRSDPLHRPSSIEEAADAAEDLLDALVAIESIPSTEGIDWVGNAFGGHVGYQLATRSGRLRSLVAISAPTQPIDPALRRKIRLLRPLLRVLGPVGPVRSAIMSAMLTDASQRDHRIRGVVSNSLAGPSKRSMALAVDSFILRRTDVTSLLPRIPIPGLFVASDDRGDWSPDDARAAADAAPDAAAVTIEGARTLIPLEKPRETAERIRAFWNARL